MNAWIASVGTFSGGLCFAIGGVLQAFEQPSSDALPAAEPALG